MTKCRDCRRVLDPDTGDCPNKCRANRQPHMRQQAAARDTSTRVREAERKHAATAHIAVAAAQAGLMLVDPKAAERSEMQRRRARAGWRSAISRSSL